MEAIEENRFPEQLVDVPVPQIMEAIAEDRFPEQIVNSPVPQFFEAIVENRVGEQTVDFSVPQFMGGRRGNYAFFTSGERAESYAPPNMEVYAGRVRAPPQERVQNRILEPVSTGKLFTVKLRHHRDDHASLDNVGFIKGLDKHNMPRFGDVMCAHRPRSSRAFWAMWLLTCLCTAFKQKRSGRSSRRQAQTLSLCAFSRVGVRRARLRARQLGVVAVLRQGTLLLGLLA